MSEPRYFEGLYAEGDEVVQFGRYHGRFPRSAAHGIMTSIVKFGHVVHNEQERENEKRIVFGALDLKTKKIWMYAGRNALINQTFTVGDGRTVTIASKRVLESLRHGSACPDCGEELKISEPNEECPVCVDFATIKKYKK